ncbi:MAG: hypothetical protein M5U09_08470 [Gammaproteobacteria bacterium]|nr:hypothetical protein [Gammaproteobacteria bacterium]
MIEIDLVQELPLPDDDRRAQGAKNGDLQQYVPGVVVVGRFDVHVTRGAGSRLAVRGAGQAGSGAVKPPYNTLENTLKQGLKRLLSG